MKLNINWKLDTSSYVLFRLHFPLRVVLIDCCHNDRYVLLLVGMDLSPLRQVLAAHECPLVALIPLDI